MASPAGVRPLVPGFWQRIWVRSLLVEPNSSELRWLLADVAAPGGARRLQFGSWWMMLFAMFWIVCGLAGFGVGLGAAVAAATVAVLVSVGVQLLRPVPIGRFHRHLFGVADGAELGMDTVDPATVRTAVRRNRWTGGLALAGVCLTAFNAAAASQVSEPTLVLDEVSCSASEPIELVATIRNTSDDVTIGGLLDVVIETAAGDRFEATPRYRADPGETTTVVASSDLAGAVVTCDATL